MFLREVLPPKILDLFAKARTYALSKNFKQCWATSSGVFIRVTNDTPPIQITTFSDIDKILKWYTSVAYRNKSAVSVKPLLSYANISSLKDHFSDIDFFIKNNNPLIFAMCETWLTPVEDTNTFNISGYYLLRNDRNLKHPKTNNFIRGGCIGFYVHQSCQAQIVSLSLITPQ